MSHIDKKAVLSSDLQLQLVILLFHSDLFPAGSETPRLPVFTMPLQKIKEPACVVFGFQIKATLLSPLSIFAFL